MLKDADEGHRGLGSEKIECSVALLVDGACVLVGIDLQFAFVGSLAAHHHEDDVRDLTDVQDRVNIITINDPENEALLLRAHIVVGAGIWTDVGLKLRILFWYLIHVDLRIPLLRHRLHLFLRHSCIPQLLRVLLAVFHEVVPHSRRVATLAEPKDAHNLGSDVVDLALQRLNALLVQVFLVLIGQKIETAPLHQQVLPLLLPHLAQSVESLLFAALERAHSRRDARDAFNLAGRLLIFGMWLVLLFAV